MDESQILFRVFRIESQTEREAFLDQQLQGAPSKRALIERILTEEEALLELAKSGNEIEFRQRVDQLLSRSQVTQDMAPTREISDGNTPDAATIDETVGAPFSVAEGAKFAERYILQNKIGEGGMGEVWRAKQIEPVKRTVAIKLIKKGMDSKTVIHRFEQERQALAMMDHPNIASVLDGGVCENGQPFFVMEFVDGMSLNEYADASKLSPYERLKLFIPVCHAVQHAHQKGVIHRDLKPANILVTTIDRKPVPKVIDFGVAKATGGNLIEASIETQFGSVIGTIEYMAPEQAGLGAANIDTQADIYSLGVILYELLTGLRPFDRMQLTRAGLSEMLRVIKEDEPSKPSTRLSTHDSLPSLAAVRQIEPKKLKALLHGELDWVVMKCLEKNRERRYETASSLARDLQRFLSGDTVEARPASTGYRLGKFLKRNKVPAVAAAFVVTTLIVGITGTSVALLEAREQRRVAVEQKELAEGNRDEAIRQKGLAEASERKAQTRLESFEKATNSLVGVFTNLDPYSEEKEGLPLRQILAQNLKSTADSLLELEKDAPVDVGLMQALIGGAMSDLGNHEEGITILERSYNSLQSSLGTDEIDTLNAGNKLALAYRTAGRLDEATALLETILQQLESSRGVDDLETLACMNNLAITYKTAGDMKKAMPLYLATRSGTRKLMGDDHESTLAATNDLAMAHVEMGQLQKALPLYLDTLQRSRQVHGDDHPFTLNTISNLANLYGQASQHDKSIPLFIEALAGRRKKLGPTHPLTSQSMHNLGMAYTATGESGKAVQLLVEALEARKARLGENHQITRRSMQSLAEAYFAAGKKVEAIETLNRLLEKTEASLGSDHPDTMYLMNNLAAFYWQEKQFDKSVSLFTKLLPLHQESMGKDHPLTINVQANLAVNLRDSGELEQAIEMMEDAIVRLDKHPPLNVARLSWIRDVMNQLYEQDGQYNKVEPKYRMALQRAIDEFGEEDLNTASAKTFLGANLIKQGKFKDAEELLRAALSTRQRLAPDDWTTFNTQSLLGESLFGQDQFERAETLLLDGYEGMKSRESAIPSQAVVLRLSESVQRLLKLYQASGDDDEMRKWEQALKKIEDGVPSSR